MFGGLSRKWSVIKLTRDRFFDASMRMQSRRGPPTGSFSGASAGSRNPYDDTRAADRGYNEFIDPRARGGDPRFSAMNNRAPSNIDQFGRSTGQQMPRGISNEAPRDIRQGMPTEVEEPEKRAPIVKPGPPRFLLVENLPDSFQTSEQTIKAYDGIVRVQLNRASKNLLNTDILKELVSWVHYLGNEDNVKAIILSSATSTADSPIFSLGLDINEFIHPVKERFEAFWNLVQETWMLLTSFPKVIVADINGDSVSIGSCMLAMACDYRIQMRNCKIGFNDVLNGMVIPPWLISHTAYLIGNRQSERLLQTGQLLSADEALKIGLIDEVAPSMEACHEAAERAVQRLLRSPDQGRWMVKDMSRRELFRFLSEEDDRRYDIEFFSKFVQHPDVQKNLQHHELKSSEKL